MDINSLLGTVLSDDSVSGMSQNAQVSDSETRNILGAALPLLLGGALSQANNANTSAGFASALNQHSATNTSNLGTFFNTVDTDDGAKIVNHLFGSNSTAIVNQIAKDSGVKAKDVTKVLASAAPLLMSLLGKETAQQQSANSGLGVGDIMGSLLGGGGANSTNLLMSMLGGGQPQQQSSLGGSLLTSLLGGGAQPQQQNGSSALLGLLGSLLK